ncbi:PREDICTED: putative killer cell immunoglobulin-like receptor like protein KIR3DP1 [Galeopterus variegatus]|uniref:Killer cell immunoglobulin-like receptor like protein KIR3DP1 n=1 Tax=Galeopterus variegatus TaxID=482537 RepID=A0ABM0S3V1_GALVR|nr:PREDICTED: putative killer cell immunoglobulin-like receptor like protein KIR3DP1 [Galeopterus variegatus]
MAYPATLQPSQSGSLLSVSRSNTMSPTSISLLCLGFLMVQIICIQAGDYDKLFLSSWPSPVVPQGGQVTLWCHSDLGYDIFKLYKEDGARVPELQDRIFKNKFTMNSVTTAHAGTYRCFRPYFHSPNKSAKSNPLKIMVTGVHRKPSLLIQPGPMVKSGENLTLICCSEVMFDSFVLILQRSVGVTEDPLVIAGEPHDGGSQAHFFLAPVTSTHAGTYRCYGFLSHSPYEWSAPSDFLDIVITGLYKKPTLSAQPWPVVKSGENRTLFCSSQSSFDFYHLYQEGKALERRLPAVQSPSGTSQASFPLGPATPAHSGTYTCYGSFSGFPYQWSAPSDPLHLSVTVTESHPPQGQSSKMNIILGLSAAIVSTAIFLFALIGHWCSIKNHATIMDTEPREDQVMDGEVPAPEETQEVTYAQLNHQTLSQTRFTPTSPSSKCLSAEPRIYTELTIHQAHAEVTPGPRL